MIFNRSDVVLLEQVENVFEVGHIGILTSGEGSMVAVWNLLVVNNCLNLALDPSTVLVVSKRVFQSNEHSDWYLVDCGDVKLWNSRLTIMLNVSS